MPGESERVAVLESRANRVEKDVGQLYKFFREHMAQEEKDRKDIIEKLSVMNNKMDNQKSFWAGMIFAFTGVGAVIGSAIVYLKGG